MSPESYVLLLIGCWLLLASTTLWGILRVTRRHHLEYPDAETELPTEQQDAPTYVPVQLVGPGLKRLLLAFARLPSVIAPTLMLHRRSSTD